jgi:hypothetical protein
MKYYEIWFYYYGENDSRTDMAKEFTFYCKTDKAINSDADMIAHLKEMFPVTEKFNCDAQNCINSEHYEHMSKWFEISAQEFTNSCGIPA